MRIPHHLLKPVLVISVAATLGLGSTSAFSASTALCKDQYELLNHRISVAVDSIPKDDIGRLRYFYEFFPQAVQDPASGRVTVDLSQVRHGLFGELAAHGLHPDELWLEIDGGAANRGRDLTIPFSALDAKPAVFAYQGGSPRLQHYFRLVLKEKGKPVHITDNTLIEKDGFFKLEPKAFANLSEPEISLPSKVTDSPRLDLALVPLSARAQHRNMVWNVDPSPRYKDLRSLYERHGPRLQPKAELAADGRTLGWTIELPPGSGVLRRFPAEAIHRRGGAAFNQHTFFWDDHFVAEALANTDPETALNTLVFWLDHLPLDGGFARELDFKGTPYLRSTMVKFGKSFANREFFNPLLTGWAWDELYRWNPEKAAPYLPRVVAAMEKQQKWLLDRERGIAVYGADGKLQGLRWTNLGKGEDNAPTALDEYGADSLPKYGKSSQAAPGREKAGLSVALLSQVMLQYGYIEAFQRSLGKFAEADAARAQGRELGELLRQDYRNANGWYVNRVPVGKSGWEREGAETLEGMWAVAAGAAQGPEIRQLLERYLENPRKFGGRPFLAAVPADNPYYVPEGAYWRGGGWPPQWRMVSRALKDNGFLREAARFDRLHLAAQTSGSDLYKMGYTPPALVERLHRKWPPDGVPPGATFEEREEKTREESRNFLEEVEKAKKGSASRPGTIYEFYGIQDVEGRHIATFGQEIISKGLVGQMHETRGGRPAPNQGFAGWGIAVPLSLSRSLVQDAVRSFEGPPEAVGRWLYESLLTNRATPRHLIGDNPSFRPLADFLEDHPKATAEDFESELAKRNTPELKAQLELLRKGYIELKPVFDPGEGQTALQGFSYNGVRYILKLDRQPDGSVRITIDSPQPLRVQFAPFWEDGTAGKAGTRIFELGGNQSSVLVKNGEITR